ncbi:MAG: hypothetical protein CL666_13260 [Balneola sp.]|nr:hypothetical protein [Balneola sp.]|tara:strand:+ start:10576 stop:12174 length:1599 start_codon:yes stop_codon:yes gene_type:complete
MKEYKFLLLFFISGTFLFSCSTGPEFERGNVFDPAADIPNAKFLDIENIIRAEIAYKSFIIVVNSVVIEQGRSLKLVSDKDGLFYQNDTITSDTIKVGYTKLSGHTTHTISLLIGEVKYDEINRIVSKPYKVTLKALNLDKFQPDLIWDKYKGDDFKSYKVKVQSYNQDITLKEFYDINDTVFTNFRPTMQKSQKYFVESYSKKYSTKSVSNSVEIRNNIIDDPNVYSKQLVSFNDEIYFHYIKAKIFNDIAYFSINAQTSTNRTITKSLGESVTGSKGFFLKTINTLKIPELYASFDNNIYQLDPVDLTLISDRGILSTKVNEGTISPHDMIYHNASSNYVVTFNGGNKRGKGPYIFDKNFNPINSYLPDNDRFATNLLGINKNTLFTNDSFYQSGNLLSYSITQDGNLRMGNRRDLVGFNISNHAISDKHNKLFIGSSGQIFSADLDINNLGFLPDIHSAYTDFLVKESSPDTLFASSYDGFLYKIHIPSNQIVSKQHYEYEIRNILAEKNNLFLVLENYDKFIIFPVKP